MVTVMLFSACSVCKIKLGRTLLEIDKQELVCKCSQLKRIPEIGKAISMATHNEALYAVGPVMTKGDTGLYQYYTNRPGARSNRFAWYNGKTAYAVTTDNIETFIDSLTVLGVSHKTINKKLWDVKKSMGRPAVGGSDSF